jgi:hypothetical protein
MPGAQGRRKGPAVLTPTEKQDQTSRTPARFCALEDYWQVLLALISLRERVDNLEKRLVCEVNERCLPHRRLPGKDDSGEKRQCTSRLDP